MMQFDRMTLGKKARELGFVRDTFEKVCRLADVLDFIQKDVHYVLPVARRTVLLWLRILWKWRMQWEVQHRLTSLAMWNDATRIIYMDTPAVRHRAGISQA